MTRPPPPAGAVRRPGVIAIFGGTFDPPHWGHVRAAEAVRDRLGVEEVWFVPAAAPPHRTVPPVVAAEARLRMVRDAIRGRDRLVASSIELDRPGPSWTIDTLERIVAERPPAPDGSARVVFVVGSDAYREIPTWRRYRDLLDHHPVVVVSRHGHPLSQALEATPEGLRNRITRDPDAPLVPPRIFALEVPLPDPSSEAIRTRLDARLPVAGLLPPPVFSRIGEQGHYR